MEKDIKRKIGDVEVTFSSLGLDLVVGKTRVWLNLKGAKELAKLIIKAGDDNFKGKAS